MRDDSSTGRGPETVFTRPVITYYRESDGHTYWRDVDGEWHGAPTYLDGSVDWPNGGPVESFEIEEDRERQLGQWLTAITADPPLNLDAPDV